MTFKFIILDIVFSVCSSVAYSQNFQTTDLTASKSSSAKTELKKINLQEPSCNFYKTDSIFSFHSKKGYFPSLLHNFGEQAKAPLKFKAKQWIISGSAVGITAILIHFDGEIDEWATTQKQTYNWINKSSPVITKFGSIYGNGFVAGFGLISAAFSKQKGVETSLLATQAVLTSGFWAMIIKQFTGREDPYIAYLNSKLTGGKWYGPFAFFDQDLIVKKSFSSYDAFPSGHTACAFSIATVFATRYSDIKLVPLISYSLASLVGISRLTEHQHWSSDVFAGGLLGYLCGKQVVTSYNKTHQRTLTSGSLLPKNRAKLAFIQIGNQPGLSVTW